MQGQDTHSQHARLAETLDALDFVWASGNPLLSGAGEPNMILDDDGVTVHCIYRVVLPPEDAGKLRYTYASNALLTNWSTPVDLDITYPEGVTTVWFPEVKKHKGVCYMELKHAFSSGGVYWYTSPSPQGPWTIGNGGNPIIEPGANSTDYNRILFNTGFCFDDDDNIHRLVESTTSLGGPTGHTGEGPFGPPMWITYCKSTIASPAATMPALPTIHGGGNANMFYVPERNAILAIYAATELGAWPVGMIAEHTRHRLQAVWAYLDSTNPLELPDCWYQADGTWEATDGSQRQPGDANLLFTPGKTHAAILLVNVDQATGWQAYLPRRLGITNQLSFFDRIVGRQFSPSGLAGGLSYRPQSQPFAANIRQSVFGGSLALVPWRGEAYTQLFVCDRDDPCTKYGQAVWDSSNERFEIDTYGHGFQIWIRGSGVQFTSPVLSDLSVYRTGSGQYPQVNVGKDSGHKIDLTWDNDNSFAEINTSSRAYPIHYGASVHQFNKTVQIVGFSNPPNGAGFEIGYDGTQGILQVFDRGASSGRALWLNVGVGDVLMGNAVAVNQTSAPATTLDVNGPIGPKSYTVATLPTPSLARRIAYAGNGRKSGEGVGAGTGVLVFDDGSAWRAVDTGATVAA